MTSTRRQTPIPRRRAINKVAETGSESVFESLFERHWESICRALYRLLGDWDEAEDLALETFLQFYRRPPPDRSNPAGWLYQVATNLGFNTLRARKRRQRYEQQAGEQVVQDTAPPDPAMAVERSEDRERVRQALQAMKPRAARILILRYSGLTYAEIAAALEIAPGSVGTLLARAEQEFEDGFKKDVFQS